MLVPTTAGVEVLDGATGTELTVLSPDLGFQNSPLVTDDPDGDIGITVAGYDGNDQGEIRHYEITRLRRSRRGRARRRGRCSTTTRSAPVSPAALPSAPHRAPCPLAPSRGTRWRRRTAGSSPSAPRSAARPARLRSPRAGGGDGDGSRHRRLLAGGCRRRGLRLRRRPVRGVDGRSARWPNPSSPWPPRATVGATGSSAPTGACSPSATPGTSARCPPCTCRAPIVGIAPSVDGAGLLARGCRRRRVRLRRRPVLRLHGQASSSTRRSWALAVDVTTAGYWLVGADGGVFAFGAHVLRFAGRARTSPRPVVSVAATTDGYGYWLVGADGGRVRLRRRALRRLDGADPSGRPGTRPSLPDRGVGTAR